MPKKYGRDKNRCQRCGTHRGVISKYKLHYCRRCMREVARSIGFNKYS